MPPPYQTSLLVEGWRGVNHSFALVNQLQLLQLRYLPGLRLYHRDLPFAFGHWEATRNDAGLAAEDRQWIAALPEPGENQVDAVYRIGAPSRASAAGDRRKTVTFMVTELGLSATSFEKESLGSDGFTRDDNLIVTPSRWARDRIVEYGFAADKVQIVPHGVDTAAFHPPGEAERQSNRANLGIHDDEVVFLNIGVAVWNKGIDLLLRAFAVLRGQGRRVRLILKDQRDVYGIGVEHMLRHVTATCPELASAATIDAISVIPGNLDLTRLRLLFAVADGYVSPYRAEGFNLPVLEAIACGVPVIVPRGGATDDFCPDDVAWRITARPGDRLDPSGALCRFVEPDLDELIAAMAALADGRRPGAEGYAAGRAAVLREYTWQRAAAEVARLTVGAGSDPAARWNNQAA